VDAQTAPGTRSGSVPENNADRRRDLFIAQDKRADLDQYEIVQIDNTGRIRKKHTFFTRCTGCAKNTKKTGRDQSQSENKTSKLEKNWELLFLRERGIEPLKWLMNNMFVSSWTYSR
jgi:hypothetical protein